MPADRTTLADQAQAEAMREAAVRFVAAGRLLEAMAAGELEVATAAGLMSLRALVAVADGYLERAASLG